MGASWRRFSEKVRLYTGGFAEKDSSSLMLVQQCFSPRASSSIYLRRRRDFTTCRGSFMLVLILMSVLSFLAMAVADEAGLAPHTEQ